MRRRTDCFYQHEYQDGKSKSGVDMMNGKTMRYAGTAVLMILGRGKFKISFVS